VLDIISGTETKRMTSADAFGFCGVAVLPDGRHVVGATFSDNPMANMSLMEILGAVKATVENPNALSGPSQSSVRIWDLVTSAQTHRFDVGQGACTSLALSPDGRSTLTAHMNGAVTLWRLPDTKQSQQGVVSENFEIRQLTGHTDDLQCVAISSDGGYGLTASGAGSLQGKHDFSVRHWDLDQGIELQKFEDENDYTRINPTSLAYSRDLEQVGVCRTTGGLNSCLQVWDVATGSRLMQIQNLDNQCLVFAPNGKRLAAGAYTGGYPRIHVGGATLNAGWDVILFDVTTRKQTNKLRGHRHEIRCITASRNASALLSGGADGRVNLWTQDSFDTGSPAKTLIHGDNDTVLCVAFAPNGLRAVSGGVKGTLHIWSLDGGHHDRIQGATGFVETAVFLRDNRHVLTLSRESQDEDAKCFLQLWDANAGVEVGKVQLRSTPKTNVAFSESGNRAIYGATDRSVRVLDLSKPFSQVRRAP